LALQRTGKYNAFLASHSQCSAGSRLRLANFSKLGLGGPEPVSLKKIAFMHINEILMKTKI
jgi:hypothetical protein